jgi:hypothetical protein
MLSFRVLRTDLCSLLNDHAERTCEDVKNSDILTDEFFEEILLTYRLIFGQDDKSWKAFVRTIGSSQEDRSQEKPWNCDPLLATLCGQSCLSEGPKIIYDEIEAGELAGHYEPHTEFPFFGGRLIKLQEFVKHHQPHNVRGLLADKRDVAAWYTLWSNQVCLLSSFILNLNNKSTNVEKLLVFFATFTIFLMIISLIFQIWQVILAKDQLNQH